jgi:hypothetical protein
MTDSIVLKKIPHTAPGAKRLTERYGDALLCVRYRADRQTGQRLTTVELIVAQRPMPVPLQVRIGYEETELRRQAKTAGAVWDAQRKLWKMSKAAVRKLKLEARVVAENG